MNRECLKGMAIGAALAVSLSVTAFAAERSITVSDGIRVVMNGQDFQPKDGNGAPVELFSYNGTVYAPIRAICEAAGMDVSYDRSTQTAHITSDRQTDTSSQTEVSTSGANISDTRAKEIALAHAGVSAADATFTEVKLSKGIGSAKYKLDFHTDTTEYDYEIDAVNGNVLKFDQEYHGEPVVKDGSITSDRAREIAKERVPNAIITKCKLEKNDGREIYEISLRSGLTKYECEIDASTGSVIKWEIDD